MQTMETANATDSQYPQSTLCKLPTYLSISSILAWCQKLPKTANIGERQAIVFIEKSFQLDILSYLFYISYCSKMIKKINKGR